MGKFKEKNGKTRVGAFLQNVAPEIIDKVGSILPSNGALGIVKNLINTDSKLTPEEKTKALELLEMDIKDLKDARSMYKSGKNKMADSIADRVIKLNLWVVLIAILIEIISVIYITDKVLIAIISGAIGSVTTALIQERQQVINFFFGSSIGSKEKNKLITKK